MHIPKIVYNKSLPRKTYNLLPTSCKLSSEVHFHREFSRQYLPLDILLKRKFSSSFMNKNLIISNVLSSARTKLQIC